MNHDLKFLNIDIINQATNRIVPKHYPPHNQGIKFSVIIDDVAYNFKQLVAVAANIKGLSLSQSNIRTDKQNTEFFEILTGYRCVEFGNTGVFASTGWIVTTRQVY